MSRTLPTQHLQRGFAGAFVLVQLTARRQRDQGLAQRVLVTAVDGVRAAPAADRAGGLQVLPRERGE